MIIGSNIANDIIQFVPGHKKISYKNWSELTKNLIQLESYYSIRVSGVLVINPFRWLVERRILPEVGRFSKGEKKTVPFDCTYEILRRVFQGRELSSDIPTIERGVYLFLQPSSKYARLLYGPLSFIFTNLKLHKQYFGFMICVQADNFPHT